MSAQRGPVHRYVDAAPGCWALYCSLEPFKQSLDPRDAPTVTQWLVDGYAVQHATNLERANRQSVALHLMSLCASFERGATGTQLRVALADWSHREYEALLPLPDAYPLTVVDVVRAPQGERTASVSQFAYSTWTAWSGHHDRVRRWLDSPPERSTSYARRPVT